jgi:uncharacterized protein
MKKLNFILIFLLLTLSASALTLTQQVTDDANILTDQEEAILNSIIQEIDKNTTVEIAIITTNDYEEINSFAIETFEQTGIGKKDLDNGLLIIVSPEKREFRIETGYGLEGTLPDATVKKITDTTFIENFGQEQYGKGLQESLLVISAFLVGNEEVTSKFQSNYNVNNYNSYLPYLIFLIILFLLSSKKGGRVGFLPMILGAGLGRGSGGFGGSGGLGGFGGGAGGGGGFGGKW